MYCFCPDTENISQHTEDPDLIQLSRDTWHVNFTVGGAKVLTGDVDLYLIASRVVIGVTYSIRVL